MSSNRPNPTFVVRRTGQDELQHWKYVKKEKVNGKWKYYYSWDELKKDAQNALGVTAKKNMDTAKRLHTRAVKNYSNSYKDLQAGKQKYDSIPYKKSLAGILAKRKTVAQVRDLKDVQRETANKAKAYMEARSEYMKTPLGKLEKAKSDVKSGYNKAKKAVSKFFGSLAKKADKYYDRAKAKVKYEAPRVANSVKKKAGEIASDTAKTADKYYDRAKAKAKYEINKRRYR